MGPPGGRSADGSINAWETGRLLETSADGRDPSQVGKEDALPDARRMHAPRNDCTQGGAIVWCLELYCFVPTAEQCERQGRDCGLHTFVIVRPCNRAVICQPSLGQLCPSRVSLL